MKALNVNKMGKTGQQGFTIIELVVVILLLGILTATALPRFMDVTDEAHAAVVDAVQGGLITGGALFRAQYIGTGEPLTAVTGFGDGTLFADTVTSSGYPAGPVDGVLTDENDCLAIYNGVLQTGRPNAVAAAFDAASATQEGIIEAAAAATVDFVITDNLAANPTACILYYVGQFKSGTAAAPNTIQTLTYTVATGDVVEGTYDLDDV